MTPDADCILHASCVAHQGRAVLILGASGSGKSSLALQLMALGAGLVADDRTRLTREGHQVIADVPEAISGLIEARGVGILRADPVGPAPVALVVSLDENESDRLPEKRLFRVLGQSVPLLAGVATPHFPAALMQMLACGRHSP
ncbi:HPr kinase/phosphorylase [Shimia sediminis]|uniref:HPr kinase/phosphorylase n=1 Tax=Shimia sediminis TaxID=2497945 RepID=UPI000F8CA380|nr:HPr kinase/phosphatase C-terminal domain-containing protein [Shimia sediminis]